METDSYPVQKWPFLPRSAFSVDFRLRRTESAPHRKSLCGLDQNKNYSFLNRNRFIFFISLFLISAFILSGCHTQLFKGLIYTRVKIPLTKNLNDTPVAANSGTSGKIVIIQEPFTGYGIYTEIYSNAIGDIAKKNGLKKVHFADQEIYSILGIWTSSTVHIHGE